MDTTIYTSSSPLIHNLPVTSSTTLTTTKFNKIAGLLSASLYNYPIPSAIREILQNALDANKASKTTNKVKIILPCNDSPFISIQDFGLGISPEFFSQFYCDLGYSTKSSDNNYTGGFGIGKLAPLSFSSQLFINSVCNNQEHTYLITKENDQFSFKHLSSSSSSSPSGTTVKFPCQASKHREVHHAVLYFCEFIPSLVEVYEQGTDGNLRKNIVLSEHLEYFQSSEIEDPVRLSFKYFLPRNAGGVDFSLGAKSFTSIPILLSFLIGDIAYSLSTSLENQLFSYYKENLKDEINKIRIEEYRKDKKTLKLYPFFSNCINSSEHLSDFNLTVILQSNNFRDIYSGNYQPSLEIEENLEYHNIVIQLPPNAVTLTSSREFIQDTPQNNSFLLNVIYAVLSKIVYLENSLPREYGHFIQQGDLAQFLYEMIDPAFLEEKLSLSNYCNIPKITLRTDREKGLLYKNTVYPRVDPRIKNPYHIGEYCPTQTSYSLLEVPFDSKLFRTKQFINSYITENFCYSAKTDVGLSLLDCSREESFVKDFRFKSFYQHTKYNTGSKNERSSSNTGLFIQCSSLSFISFCKYLESVKVLTKCFNSNDSYYCSKIKHSDVNHLEFTYFLSFFSHTRKGYIVYYEYKTSSDLKIKNLVSRLQKQYPDSVDWDILFVPYYSDRDRTLTLSYNFVTEKLIYPEKFDEGYNEHFSNSDLTSFLNYFRSSLIILNYGLEEETVKEIPKRRLNKVEKSPLEIAATAIKSGGFYTLDPTKSESINISTKDSNSTVCSPFRHCKTYDVSVPTNTLPKTPPGAVNIIYSTSKDCGSNNYTIGDVIPPNLDFNRVYFASDSVKSLLLNCPSWITIEEYCFQQYKFYLEEYKEVFELFGYSFPEFLVGSCTTHSYDFSAIEPFVRTFVHQIFSLVDFLQPNVKTKLLKLFKEDWKVIHWMHELYWTPISCFKNNVKDRYVYEHYNYHKLNPTLQFKLRNLSDSDKQVKRVRICSITSDNGLFTTWVSSNETQDKFFKELFSRYPLLQSVMLNLISCRKKTPFDSPSLDHPIFRYLQHENSKNCNRL